MRFFPSSLSIATLVSLVLVGCGSGDETSRIKLVPVSGTVSFNGKPLGEALVSFVPDESNEKSTPGGDSTGPSGNYKAMYRGRSGLAPGKYKIVVSKTVLPPGMTPSGDDDPYMRQLSMQSAGTKDAPTKIEGTFEGDVPNEGGILDFEVKETPAPKTKKR